MMEPTLEDAFKAIAERGRRQRLQYRRALDAYCTPGLGARIALTAGLLFEVWTHSHWSVALALTLISMAEEGNGLLRRVAEVRLDDLERQ